MNHIDLKYCGILATRLENFKVKGRTPYKANFRCPVCGDSKKSKSKTRGWLLDKGDVCIYHCHNCGLSTNLFKFLKIYDPHLFNEYVVDLKLERRPNLPLKLATVKPLDKLITKKPQFQTDGCPLAKLKKISTLPVDHQARKYIKSRKIPSRFHYLLYYAPDFNAWVNTIIPGKMAAKKEPRIVLPFLDPYGKLIGVAGRSLDPKSDLRYITIKIDEDAPKIFGLDRVNFNKRYFIVEGQFDSFFLPNCIAMAGADGAEQHLENLEKSVWIFDNEPRNAEIVKRMLTVAEKGYNIVVWPSEWATVGKDINDLVLKGIDPVDIYKAIKNNTYSGLEAKLAITMWKRV